MNKNILLINQGKISHYRIPVYNYLAHYLLKYNFNLAVISEGIQQDSPHAIKFHYRKIKLGLINLMKLFRNKRPDAVIFWLDPHLYTFPILFLSKLFKIKTIHWGHRRPIPPCTFTKKIVYNLEHYMDDAVILYSEQLRKYVFNCFQSKVFVANNTLNLTTYKPCRSLNENVKIKYGISTSKNIICMGW